MVWIVLSAVLVHAVVCNEGHDVNDEHAFIEPTWTYQCVPDLGCTRRERPLPTLRPENTSIFYESVEFCRTVCGQFGGLWPRPKSASLGSHTVGIHPYNIRYHLSNVPPEAKELLQQMTRLTTKNMVAECHGNVTEYAETQLVVSFEINTGSTAMTWDTSEQYQLILKTEGNTVLAHIKSETVYGARHGLESLTNLVGADRSMYPGQKKCGLQMVSEAKIADEPAYKHRGFLLDTSRNFIPMSDIKRMIDGMGAVKMNVFHWHVTDSQSFPLESPRVPQFTRYGAYSADQIYKVDEVRNLIKYAQERGVRVVIEIDAPAHAGNGWQWGKEYGYDDLAVCVNSEPWRKFCIEPPCGQLNPANSVMYRVLHDLYRDIADILPKPALLHMGGDEVFLGCWNSSEQVVSYMKDKGFETNTEGFIRLWAEFHAKALQSWDSAVEASGGEKQPVMLWSSELTQSRRIQRYLDKSRYVIEVWEVVNSLLLQELLDLGYKTVAVPKDVWYLDHGFWGSTMYSNWRRMYEHVLPGYTAAAREGLLGGETAMWSEYVDQQGLDARVWPRAGAVAERLWSNPSSSSKAAEPRMHRLVARLTARGLRPDAIMPAWCSQNDGKCL